MGEATHRLAKDALILYTAGGTGFLVAEAVLPGIFSQRVSMTLFLAVFFALVVAVAWTPWRDGVSKNEPSIRTQKSAYKKTGRIAPIVSGATMAIFFFLISANIAPPTRFALALAAGVGAATLVSDVLRVRRV